MQFKSFNIFKLSKKLLKAHLDKISLNFKLYKFFNFPQAFLLQHKFKLKTMNYHVSHLKLTTCVASKSQINQLKKSF